ncbi:HNH endonuclease signature motif containing protein [Nocardia salmonicida]|uniref:HNH endonuclease signature motif containing protein n=1 Tax=Nocardia salmonicida TaxID=53431 RepID=UPI0033DDAC50
MTSDVLNLEHPVTRLCAGLDAALDEALAANLVFLPTPAKAELLVELQRDMDRLTALQLRLMAASEDVAAEDGARDVSSWLAPRVRQDRGPLAAAERLSGELDGPWAQTGAALASGAVNVAQAKVIVAALDNLGSEVDRTVLLDAETMLIGLAAQFAPKQLKVLGEKILEMVDPEAYDDQERKALEAAERRAHAATRLTMRQRGDGSTDLTVRIPDAIAARVKTLLDAWTSPRHQASPAAGFSGTDPVTGQRLPHERLRGQAFCALIECLDPTRTPMHGGDATTVVITIDFESLKNNTGIAVMGDGTRITASEVRRLACTANLIPAVLGGNSEVLDLGRMRRLYNRHQRLAMGIEHRTCRAEHCDIPAPWCEAHHFTQTWLNGGKTNVKDGKLLCSHHHHLAHDTRYTAELLPDGTIRFRRKR